MLTSGYKNNTVDINSIFLQTNSKCNLDSGSTITVDPLSTVTGNTIATCGFVKNQNYLVSGGIASLHPSSTLSAAQPIGTTGTKIATCDFVKGQGYLTSTDAASTYLTSTAAASAYLTSTAAASTYLTSVPTTLTGGLTILDKTTQGGDAGNGSLIIKHNNSGGSSSIIFPSTVNPGSDYAYIRYQDSSTSGGEKGKLTIGLENDDDDEMWITTSGNLYFYFTSNTSAYSNLIFGKKIGMI